MQHRYLRIKGENLVANLLPDDKFMDGAILVIDLMDDQQVKAMTVEQYEEARRKGEIA